MDVFLKSQVEAEERFQKREEERWNWRKGKAEERRPTTSTTDDAHVRPDNAITTIRTSMHLD